MVALIAAAAYKNSPQPPPIVKPPATPEIGPFIQGHQSYGELVETMDKWEELAPDLVEVGTYGKTSEGKDQFYMKISNETCPGEKTVLITACIHGNEPLSTSTVMAYAGKLLSDYGKDKAITEVVNTRTIYFIPVISPDSYPSSRHVNNVDPNRDFPTLKKPDKESVTPVKNLQDFFLKVKPDSVLSGHTFGRKYLIPWGDSTVENPNLKEYKEIATEMCRLSGYKFQRVCEMYGRPIYGTETDWYHRNGAFAMVIEFGTHQRKPTLEETTTEFERTFGSFLHFVSESANVRLVPVK